MSRVIRIKCFAGCKKGIVRQVDDNGWSICDNCLMLYLVEYPEKDKMRIAFNFRYDLDLKTLGKELFHSGRICPFCSINMDIPYIDILEFYHGSCWTEFRSKGLIYPMPKYA